ncbi:MAG: TRAP transporter large permease [Alphaproteobacteria bacterium]|nr:TRAP transporter large permease [Alphaproteobacteria bacterium]
MESLILIVIMVVLIVFGAPIGFTMAILPTVYIMMTDVLPLTTVPYLMYESIAHNPFIAIPFFMLTGELMNNGDITKRLLDLSRELVGRIRGGLSHVAVLICMIFAGMNGSAVADSAAVGAVLIPAMKRAGYHPPFTAGLLATAGTIGGIIPPSIVMIILASSMDLSVGILFATGIIPGIIVGLCLMFVCYCFALVRKYERYTEPFSFAVLWRVFWRASLALCVPFVLIGGIVTGVFGSVESGAITAALALFIGAVVYRALSWESFIRSINIAVMTSASVFIIIAAAGPFGWMLTRIGALDFLEGWLLGFRYSQFMFLLALIGFIIVAGMVMDATANIILLGPTLVKVMMQMGYHEYQSALVVCIGFLIGTVTPPVGVTLFTAAAIAKVPLDKAAWASLPFVAAETFVMLLVILIPALSLTVPRWFGML